MLPLLRNPATLPSISVVYSGWSAVVLSSTVYLLYTTNKYLKFGTLDILPLYGVYILSELLKWSFLNSKFYLNPPYHPKESRGVLIEMITSLKVLSLKNVLKGFLYIFAGIFCYFMAGIIFGAPVLEGHLETFMFSLLMTILTVFPLCINAGVESINNFVDGIRPMSEFHWLMYIGVYVTWFGAWIGAIVIPLDWGRPWQEWPVPCNMGAVTALSLYYFGSCVYSMGFYGGNIHLENFKKY